MAHKDELGAHEYDHPADVQPENKDGQGRETAIYSVVAGKSNLGVEIGPLPQGVDAAEQYAAEQPWPLSHPGVGHKDIHKI